MTASRDREPVRGSTPDFPEVATGLTNVYTMIIRGIPDGLSRVGQATLADRLFGYKCDGVVESSLPVGHGMLLVMGQATVERPDRPLEEMTPEERETAALARVHIQTANFASRRGIVASAEATPKE